VKIKKLREKNPLILHYTNEVTINDCANITLGIGASPIMSYSLEEVEEIVPLANAVVINIGTMASEKLNLFLKAGKIANKLNKPIILDPVGCFATKTRLEFTKNLLKEVQFSIIKGNLAEIKSIGGLISEGKGVDSNDENVDEKFLMNLSKSLNSVLVATGKEDVITNGSKVIKIPNGDKMLKGVTGTGCMTASLIGSFLGSGESNLNSALYGTLAMGICGELAAKNSNGFGSFKINILDNISNLNDKILNDVRKDYVYEI
jgi:hydroxyethylthiazole kinase